MMLQDSFDILYQFYSKKNKVYRVQFNKGLFYGKTAIMKVFGEKSVKAYERDMLINLKRLGVNVPLFLNEGEDFIIMEDIGDDLLLNRYENMEESQSYDFISIVRPTCDWLKSFYAATKNYYKKEIALNDVNFRNFIFVKNKVVGIDFEQVSEGSIATDIGKLAAYSLTYSPERTNWKYDFVEYEIDYLCNELNIKRDDVINEFRRELANIQCRRHQNKLSKASGLCKL